jgi:hypothetical protein
MRGGWLLDRNYFLAETLLVTNLLRSQEASIAGHLE